MVSISYSERGKKRGFRLSAGARRIDGLHSSERNLLRCVAGVAVVSATCLGGVDGVAVVSDPHRCFSSKEGGDFSLLTVHLGLSLIGVLN